MRVLVEQTEAEIRGWLSSMGLLWDGSGKHEGKVGVHVLMGGVERDEWHLYAEENAVLIGTQDMLLSRALNRGYGTARARWPMEFGLLSQDCLWVLDEVQLMGVGLATSAQLQTFRDQDVRNELRPNRSWWMSATLQPRWLKTVDSAALISSVESSATLQIPPEGRHGAVWNSEKPAKVVEIAAAADKNAGAWAQAVVAAHNEIVDTSFGRITLAIANTVREAVDLFDALSKALKKTEAAPELRLVHSRFRGIERQAWREAFLSKAACTADTNRIIVATQVVEAGVDISASALVTQLAPWPSLVQRFGRAARYGGKASVTVIDRALETPLPYAFDELASAKEALARLNDVRQARLEDFETTLKADDEAFLEKLYPFDPLHVVTRRELDELFDTSADLTGSDLDISRFIRSGEERDLRVFWHPFDDKIPAPSLQPTRLGLCSVPVNEDTKKWLRKLREEHLTWAWDYNEGSWRRCREGDYRPGQTILIHPRAGGYSLQRGWDPKALEHDLPLEGTVATPSRQLAADLAESREDLSETEQYKTIATHGGEVRDEFKRLATALDLSPGLLGPASIAARWHDLGKAHEAFNAAIRDKGPYDGRSDLAKAPRGCWASSKQIFRDRKGFRHELASTLALFEFLRTQAPNHPALNEENPASEAKTNLLGTELAELSADDFNLVAWLICTHHGKVRCAWQPTVHDQEGPLNEERPLLRGIREEDLLPSTALLSEQGQMEPLPELTMRLAPSSIGLSKFFGRSWTDRVDGLLDRHGPFTLAYLEAIFRTADIRASRLTSSDPILEALNK